MSASEVMFAESSFEQTDNTRKPVLWTVAD